MDKNCNKVIEFRPLDSHGYCNGQYQRVNKIQFWREADQIKANVFWEDGTVQEGFVIGPIQQNNACEPSTSFEIKWQCNDNAM